MEPPKEGLITRPAPGNPAHSSFLIEDILIPRPRVNPLLTFYSTNTSLKANRVETCEVPMPPSRDFSSVSLVRSLQDSEPERGLVRSLAESGYPFTAYLPHLALPPPHFLPKPDPTHSHPFFLSPASPFPFSSLFSGDLGKPGRRRKARTVFSDGQLAGLERR